MLIHSDSECPNRSLFMQSFNNMNAPIILLFFKNWAAGLTDEDNNRLSLYVGTTCPQEQKLIFDV